MTVTVIRSRTVGIEGREYADIIYSVYGKGGPDVRRHVYAVNPEGRTSLIHDHSFVSEEMGTNNWLNVHTSNIVARLKEKGEVICG